MDVLLNAQKKTSICDNAKGKGKCQLLEPPKQHLGDFSAQIHMHWDVPRIHERSLKEAIFSERNGS